ncbi:MAG: ABC transporter permease, partial [Planctomycetota bacterium]
MSVRLGVVAAWVVARRELVHLARRPARLAGAVGTPLLLWLFLGSGFAESFRPPGPTDVRYASFLLPGAMTLVAVFAAVFSAISIIEDRQAGWLQGVLVSPAPRWSLAAGRIAGSAVTAWLQAAPLLLLALLALDLDVSALGALRTLAALAVTCVAVAGLGLATAWRSET